MLYDEEDETITRTLKRYTRAKQVVIDNTLNQPPRLQFIEERVQRENGLDVSLGNVSNLHEKLTPENAATQFNLINPTTGDVIGTAQYQDLQVMLYSLYFHLATERDNAA